MSDEDQIPEERILGDNDRVALRARVKVLEDNADKIMKLAEEMREAARTVWWHLMYPPTNPKNIGTMKRDDGRLNDAGIIAINAAFEGGMKVSEAAEAFEISQSAASNRRKIWLANRNKKAN